MGEAIAARFLRRRGARVLGRNLRVGRGEIDLHVRFPNGEVVAVEVKSRRAGGVDPIVNMTEDKLDQVAALGRRLEPAAHRVDYVGVEVADDAIAIRWIPAIR